MFIRDLQLTNFKNYKEVSLEFSSNINCLYGNNGSGKTNILDAVYYLSFCKSYLNVVDKQNIRFGENFFSINSKWSKNNELVGIQCVVKSGAKKVVKKNKKEYDKLADHIGLFPVVMISPYDRDLISEGSELRRKWMDSIISQFDKEYLLLIQRYQKILEQRNALLKEMYHHGLFDRESIEVWNDQMIDTGMRIFSKRTEFIQEFIYVFQERYQMIGKSDEEVRIEYRSQLQENDFKILIQQFEKKDALTQYSNCGVHKDDLLFTIKGHPIKKFGSQGQQKSFIISLRLAQYDWLKKHLDIKPVILLDDIFDKLDSTRVKHLIEIVSNSYFGQVIITDTDEGRLNDLFISNDIERKFFRIYDGQIEEVLTTN
jgi:DNA replication and repair protein RecF